jgi:hypothetical protein
MSQRNPSIDVLRGSANVLMFANHVGASSHVTTLLNLVGWIDPASAFVLLAGLVLGLGMRGNKPLSGPLSRARKLWALHVGCAAVVVALHELTGRLDSPSIAELGGPLAAAWKLLALRAQPSDYMNILPMFIAFFAAAPVLVLALRRGFTWLLLAASLALWGVTQRDPSWLRFTDPACGPESFVLPAWQLTFVLGLAAGFHAERMGAVYRRAPRATWGVLTATVLPMALWALCQKPALSRFGVRLPPELDWLTAKSSWGPLRAVYTCAFLGLGYLVLVRLTSAGKTRGIGWLVLLGRKSLYCFLVHLPFALLASGLLLPAQPLWLQDVAALLTIAIVYVMAKHDVLARYLPV